MNLSDNSIEKCYLRSAGIIEILYPYQSRKLLNNKFQCVNYIGNIAEFI